MPPCLDCYVLVESRSADLAVRFLDEFLPARRELASEYELPQYSSTPTKVFATAADLLTALESLPTEAHVVYWANTHTGDPTEAIVAPTRDGRTVFGLSVESDDAGAQSRAAQMLDRMQAFFGSPCPTLCAEEEPPPKSTEDFVHNPRRLALTR